MPVIHPYVASARGKTHGADFHIHEPQHAYLTPAKLLAMTAIDPLYDEAALAKQIIGDFKPAMTKDSPSQGAVRRRNGYTDGGTVSILNFWTRSLPWSTNRLLKKSVASCPRDDLSTGALVEGT